MSKKSTLLFLLVSILFVCKTQAQKNNLVSGGTASGAGGNVSYSVGQIDYISATGAGSIQQGVQQVYQIITDVKENQKDLFKLNLNVYPNPAADLVVLSTEETDLSELSYAIFNAEGKQIVNGYITGNETSMDLGNLPNGIYFLKIFRNQVGINSFKIIKNK